MLGDNGEERGSFSGSVEADLEAVFFDGFHIFLQKQGAAPRLKDVESEVSDRSESLREAAFQETPFIHELDDGVRDLE